MQRVLSREKIAILIGLSMFMFACQAPTRLVFGTSTPTPTATPLPTSTPTPTPTITPTHTPLPMPDLSGVVLHLEDLPAGFKEIPADEVGLDPEQLSDEHMQVGDSFAFMDLGEMTIIMGWNVLLDDISKIGFELMVEHPDLMLGIMGDAAGTEDFETMSELEGYGDISTAVTGTLVSQGITMRGDVGVISREEIGVFVMVMYFDDDKPSFSLQEIMKILDERILEAVESFR
ncbi:MAG: hypothetical protein JXA13_08965 [Anaerolineales bacterium]|nr:hypothetical protein [Anaerolineales bacterium]